VLLLGGLVGASLRWISTAAGVEPLKEAVAAQGLDEYLPVGPRGLENCLLYRLSRLLMPVTGYPKGSGLGPPGWSMTVLN